MNFENYEKYDMHVAYIECQKNVIDASELYFQRYPERRQPDKRIFKKLDSNLIEYGCFVKPRRKYEKNNEEREVNTLGYIQAHHESSLRQIENEIGVPKTTAGRILKKYKFRPYRTSVRQKLYPNDFLRRTQFAQWYIGKCNEQPNFYSKVIFSDEARISSAGIFNRHNELYWNDSNPHLVQGIRRQGRFGFNVSCFVKHNKLVYHIFDDKLTAAGYIDILEINLHQLLEEEVLADRDTFWFQQDGAPAHNALFIGDYLNEKFPNRWIGTYGPVRWPPRSPEVNPPDFFIWGF